MTEDAIKKAEKELINLDPVLGKLIKKQALPPFTPKQDYFAALCSSIVSQQVSVAAARTIFGRLKEKTNLDPKAVVSLIDADIKTIGLSRQKSRYIRDLAQHFVAEPDIYNHLDKQNDNQVIAELTQVVGIGTWTAQMFLIFTLGRPDVFAPDDVGLQRAMMHLYGWEKLPPKKELIEIAERWRPYRSVASLHLWQSLNNKPV